MDVVEIFVWVVMFLLIYGSLMVASYWVDWVLKKLGKKGIWPEGYFKW